MAISRRISRIVDFINASVLADIACDHAYISIEAIKQSKAKRCVACDINKSSIERALKNINGLSDKIELRQADGLNGLTYYEADTAVIAGVGGRLICEILNKDAEKTKSIENYIIQPQKDASLVRRFLHKTGFMITDEDIIKDKNIYYPIIKAALGLDMPYTDIEYIFGKLPLLRQNPVLKEYIMFKLRQIEGKDIKRLEDMYAEALSWF